MWQSRTHRNGHDFRRTERTGAGHLGDGKKRHIGQVGGVSPEKTGTSRQGFREEEGKSATSRRGEIFSVLKVEARDVI